MLSKWADVITDHETSTERRAEAYCVKFTILQQVVLELNEAEFEPDLILANMQFEEALSSQNEAFVANAINRLTTWVFNNKRKSETMTNDQLTEALSSFLTLNIRYMPKFHRNVVTDLAYARTFSSLIPQDEIFTFYA